MFPPKLIQIAAMAQAQSARLHGPVDNALDLAAATNSRNVTQVRMRHYWNNFCVGRHLMTEIDDIGCRLYLITPESIIGLP